MKRLLMVCALAGFGIGSAQAAMVTRNIDYTVDASGNVVGGSRQQIRRYTEYWTFLRGKEGHGAPRVERV